MTWNIGDLDTLLVRDVDDVVDRARILEGKDRTAALREALELLVRSGESLTRLKTLLFIQTLLATAEDGKLASSVADSAANELARVVTSASDANELKRPALDGLALVFLKAKELTYAADTRVRAAFTAAQASPDPYLSGFARHALEEKGVLSRRVVQRQYRQIYVSVGKFVATLSAAGTLAYVATKKLRKATMTKRKRSRHGSGTKRSTSHKTAD